MVSLCDAPWLFAAVSRCRARNSCDHDLPWTCPVGGRDERLHERCGGGELFFVGDVFCVCCCFCGYGDVIAVGLVRLSNWLVLITRASLYVYDVMYIVGVVINLSV